jgi:UPF0755 protein
MSDLFPGEPLFPGLPATDTRSARRAADRRLHRRRHHRRGRVAMVVAVLLLVGAGYAVWTYAVPMFTSHQAESFDYPGPGHGEVQVIVKPGDSGVAIGTTLVQKSVVLSTQAFTKALTGNPAGKSIQPGTYTLELEMRASDALADLLNPLKRVELKFTIPEGLRVTQILAKIAGSTGIPLADLQKAAADPKALGVPPVAGGNLEGWLFPATYTYQPGTNPVDILAPMVTKTIDVLNLHQVAEPDRETVLIKASIVEKEGKLDVDRGKIAQVIENRLAKSMTLGMDSTIAYGLNKSGLALTGADVATANPYNTRINVGLPPGPIASPGIPSIEAVLNPTPGPWVYFVTVNLDTGETLFATTLAEHDRYVAQMDQWLATHTAASTPSATP